MSPKGDAAKEAPNKAATSGKELTLLGHLRELRWRLTRSLIAIAIGVGVCLFFVDDVVNLLKSPTQGADVEFVAIEVTEVLGVYMKIALWGGLFLALPYVVYEAVMFVSPALTWREKTYLYLLLPGIAFFFLVGAVFAYYILLPPALKFLINPPFAEGMATPTIRISNYVTVVSKLLFFIGLSFETPIVIMFLSRIGILNPDTLARWRRYAFVGAFILAAVITPTFDPVNQTLVAVPLMVLYELGIWMGRLVRRRKAPAAVTEQPTA